MLLRSRNGHLPALKYLHENGCPWDSNTCFTPPNANTGTASSTRWITSARGGRDAPRNTRSTSDEYKSHLVSNKLRSVMRRHEMKTSFFAPRNHLARPRHHRNRPVVAPRRVLPQRPDARTSPPLPTQIPSAAARKRARPSNLSRRGNTSAAARPRPRSIRPESSETRPSSRSPRTTRKLYPGSNRRSRPYVAKLACPSSASAFASRAALRARASSRASPARPRPHPPPSPSSSSPTKPLR